MIQKSSFPQRSIDTWNGLKEEVIIPKNVPQLKEKLTNIDKETRPHKCSLGPVYYN